MSNSEQTRRPRAFPGLDAELGPARPISRADTEWLIEQVVERALSPRKRGGCACTSLRSLSLAALVSCLVGCGRDPRASEVSSKREVDAPAVSAPQRHKEACTQALCQREVRRANPLRRRIRAVRVPHSQRQRSDANVREVAPLADERVDCAVARASKRVVDELSAANDLRRKSRWQAAEAAYRDIAAQYPRAPEATVAQLAAAELRLEHLGDAIGRASLVSIRAAKRARSAWRRSLA